MPQVENAISQGLADLRYLKLDGGEMSGNITMAGAQTVDGRDVSADGTKLDELYTTIGLSALTSAEVNQLENIGAVTISSTQWGYLGALDQGLTVASNVEFAQVTVTGTGAVIFGAAGQNISSLAAGYMDYAAATAHRFGNTVYIDKDTGGIYNASTVALIVGDVDAQDSIYVIGQALNFGYNSDNDSAGFINYRGHLGGTTRFRNLNFCDGKGTVVALLDGVNHAMQMQGTYPMQFNDAGTYIYSSANSLLDLVADGQIQTTSASMHGDAARIYFEASGTTQGGEYISSDAADYLDIHFTDDDKGCRFYSGANQLFGIRRFSAGAPTATRIDLGVLGGNYYVNNDRIFIIRTDGLLSLYHLLINSDNNKLKLGTAFDAEIYFTGSHLVLDPDPVTAAAKVYIGATADDDIWFANARLTGTGKAEFNDAGTYIYSRVNSELDCVFDGSMRLGAVVTTNYLEIEADGTQVAHGTATTFDDVYIAFSSARVPSANAPNWESFIGNLNAYTFAVNDFLELDPVELPHTYKEGSDFTLHVHWATNGVDGTDRGVKWEIEYTIANSNEAGTVGDTFAAAVVVSAESTIPANTDDLKSMNTVVATVTGTTFNIGALIKMRVRRIAAAGTAPANDPFGLKAGIHIESDTDGSRTETSK